MNVYSGEVLAGRCGIDAGTDSFGEKLSVGDIVQYWTYNQGVKQLSWYSVGISVIVELGSDTTPGCDPFVMGLKGAKILMPKDLDCDHPDFDGNEDEEPEGWVFVKAKDHSLVVDGEEWPSFGFSYKS